MTPKIILILCAVIIAIYLGTRYNRLLALRGRSLELYAKVDAQFRLRHGLIGDLVEMLVDGSSNIGSAANSVKSDLRAATSAAISASDNIASAEESLAQSAKRLLAFLPGDRWKEIKRTLGDADKAVAAAVREYNTAAKAYNSSREKMPDLFLALTMGFAPAQILDLERYPA